MNWASFICGVGATIVLLAIIVIIAGSIAARKEQDWHEGETKQ